LSVKSLCETRWEARLECALPIRYQLADIHDALCDMASTSTDPITCSEAESLATYTQKFGFIVTLIFWHSMLHHINVVSKALQGATVHLKDAFDLINRTQAWLQSYRESGYPEVLACAITLAEEVDIEPIFVATRNVLRRKQFNYESADEPLEDPCDEFRVNFFNVAAITTIRDFSTVYQCVGN